MAAAMIAKPPASTGARSGLTPTSVEPREAAGADHALAQAREPLGRDAAGREAVLLEDRGERERGARRCEGFAPVLGRELARRSPRCARAHRVSAARKASARSSPFAKKRCDMLTQPSFSDSRRSGVMPRPMMNSVEPPPMSMTRRGSSDGRQHVRDAEVDEARLLVAADDVDGEAERGFGLRQERRRVARDAERVGRDRAHRGRMQSRQPLAEAREARERRLARGEREVARVVDARAEADRLAPGVEAEDLVALDAADLEAEAVRAQVDDGERLGREARLEGAREDGRAWRARSLAESCDGAVASPQAAREAAPFASALRSCYLVRMPIDYLQKILTAKVYDVAVETPLERGADAVAAARQPRAAEARGPAAGVLVQAARRVQQDGAPVAGRARAAA